MRMSTRSNRVAIITAVLAATVVSAKLASAQIARDDLVIGVNSNTTDSFRIVRPKAGADPGVTSNGGAVAMATPWSESFVQSVEFDNANNSLHNAQGNLLGADFGNANTGFQLINFATNGTDAKQVLWEIKTETAGARTDRGAGLSVSPDNSKVAWGAFDGGRIHVLQYDAGPTPGTGAGADVTGWIETSGGDGNGGAGGLNALLASATQATTWLDNNTVLAFSAFGELVKLDVTGVPFGTTSTPTATSAWTIEKEGIFATSPGNAQGTGLVYNEQIAPDIIIGSAGFFVGGTSTTEIFVWDKNSLDQIAKINLSGTSDTGREIALDSAGNLYVGSFGNQIVSVIDDFVTKAMAGTLTDNSSVLWFTNDFFASFSGLDVASSMPLSQPLVGDVNFDGAVDIFDVNVVSDNWGNNGAPGITGDANNDGTVDIFDVNTISDNWGAMGAQSVASVPEPGSFGLAALVTAVVYCGTRHRKNAR